MVDVIEEKIDSGPRAHDVVGRRIAGRRLRGRRHHGVPQHVHERDPGTGVPSRGGIDRRRHALRRQDRAVPLPPRDGRRRRRCSNGRPVAGTRRSRRRPGAGRPGLHARARWHARSRSGTWHSGAASTTRPARCSRARWRVGETSGAIDLILPALWGLAETELHSGNADAAADDVPTRSSARSRSANRPCSPRSR